MTVSTDTAPSAGVRSRWKSRLFVVVGAAVAATLTLLVGSPLINDVSTPAMNGRPSTPLNVGFAFLVAVVVSLGAWAVLALLERFTTKGRLRHGNSAVTACWA